MKSLVNPWNLKVFSPVNKNYTHAESEPHAIA